MGINYESNKFTLVKRILRSTFVKSGIRSALVKYGPRIFFRKLSVLILINVYNSNSLIMY
jgi:hypothetical protein